MIKLVLVSCLLIFIKMCMSHLSSIQDIFTPVVVSIFESRRENKIKFWKYIARNSKIFGKNVSVD